MCCFSGPVQAVSSTRIFARGTGHGREVLAYQMSFSAAADVAMILPLPVPKGSADGAVRFINLEGYPELFDDLNRGFPMFQHRGIVDFASNSVAAAAEPPLQVQEVGSFEASFVPAIKDFTRLDARFRLSDAVWSQLPQYRDFGFAVFKLKKDAQVTHPMAFEFPRANPDQLFFPTIDVHDGAVHPEAHFDHQLYCQAPSGAFAGAKWVWSESPQPAAHFADAKRSAGLIDAEAHAYAWRLNGMRKNEDLVL